MRGIYLLHIVAERSQEVAVGALGRIAFAAGSYVYIGSAQSGLEQRIAHHLRRRKRQHWHIDYLLSAPGVRVIEVLSAEAGRREECEVARLLAAAARPVRGFGSSDCACQGHLFALAGSAVALERLRGLCWQASALAPTIRCGRPRPCLPAQRPAPPGGPSPRAGRSASPFPNHAR